ncbi:DpnD/PcfM family protein [Neptuniibacter sp.]|uniref:DpnD/PcfM family protein n=1 Tax=Neptuniibacter sp. TaxID=1962643 RepID=UPI00261D807C|nr:DpnD/PcfM family protein [Neptuniibacter sp.]MCP4596245.1 hypothetical protein [Neptuniibacter sp.]
MANFKVEIKETLSKVLDIQADTAEEAMQIVDDMYRDGEELVLDVNDCDGDYELAILED